MAATPPHQITFAPDTPSTPRHGPLYDDDQPHIRSSVRLRQKRAHDLNNSVGQNTKQTSPLTQTPRSPCKTTRVPSLALHSPGETPKRKTTQRVQIHSPTSPNTAFTDPQGFGGEQNRLRPYNSVTGESMLPTPVKTPKKKQVSKSNLAGRALFQDGTSISEIAQSPRKTKKNRRYNGFSLESFRANDDDHEGQIQIFTDSRDQIPETVNTADNPFVQISRQKGRSERVPGTAKRRKVSEQRPLDPQVEEALRNDDGMVYVFRGKKVFRRFDDNGEEEEEIDPQDLGLLENSLSNSDDRRRFRTLTRKSIRPTRLFQTEQQKRSREAEKEEEATTDIEDVTTKPDSNPLADEIPTNTTDQDTSTTSRKRDSPFDSWPRSKSAAMSSMSKQLRGQKRGIAEDSDHETTAIAGSS